MNFLDYPFVQDFLSVKLPKLLQQINHPNSASSSPPTTTSTTTPTASEQIQELVIPVVSLAQAIVQDLSQNLNSQITPDVKQEPQSSSTTPVVPSVPEPEKPSDCLNEKTPSEPLPQTKPPTLYQEPPNCSNSVPPPIRPNLPKTFKFRKELNQLKELGFRDTQLLTDLLNTHNGNLDKVLDTLSEFD